MRHCRHFRGVTRAETFFAATSQELVLRWVGRPRNAILSAYKGCQKSWDHFRRNFPEASFAVGMESPSNCDHLRTVVVAYGAQGDSQIPADPTDNWPRSWYVRK